MFARQGAVDSTAWLFVRFATLGIMPHHTQKPQELHTYTKSSLN